MKFIRQTENHANEETGRPKALPLKDNSRSWWIV